MTKATSLERQMLDLINQERAKADLAPLRLEERLNEASDAHTDWMIKTDSFSHVGAKGSHADDRMRDAGFAFKGDWTWGENIALQSERGKAGIADDVVDLHESLMDSPGHRANILNPDFEVLGIGIERGEYRGFDAIVVTQNFAATDASVRLDGGSSSAPKVASAKAAGISQVAAETSREPAPQDDGGRPEVEVDDIVIAPRAFASVAEAARISGDAVSIQVFDGHGGDSFHLDGRAIDASEGRWIDADRFDDLTVRGGADGDSEPLRLRIWDGEEVSDWDRFILTASDGWDDVA